MSITKRLHRFFFPRSADKVADYYGYCYSVSARNNLGQWITKFGESSEIPGVFLRVRSAMSWLKSNGYKHGCVVNVFAGSKALEKDLHRNLREQGYKSAKDMIIQSNFADKAKEIGMVGYGYSEYYLDLEPQQLIASAAEENIPLLSKELGKRFRRVIFNYSIKSIDSNLEYVIRGFKAKQESSCS